MIGTQLIEELVQSVALSHRVRGHKRVSLLLMAAPESGKTTITHASNAKHVVRVALLTGKSILREVNEHPETEFLLFNDLTAVRAMSQSAVALLVVLLNQMTQDEHGMVGFAGKDVDHIKRSIGIIGCIPFATFTDHRARWKELGFVSRMVPFSYQYSRELVAEIKDTIDAGGHNARQPSRKLPRVNKTPIDIACSPKLTSKIRVLADARANELGQLGIRLLQNYHCLTRAHALLCGRDKVTDDDVKFLRAVDHYVSITECQTLTPPSGETGNHAPIRRSETAWQNGRKHQPRKATTAHFSKQKTSKTATS